MLRLHVDVEVVLVQVDNKGKIMYSQYYAMSFDELLKQQTLVAKKYNAAWQSGASPDVMNQMLGHMEAIKHAIWELGYKQSYQASENKNGDEFKDSIA